MQERTMITATRSPRWNNLAVLGLGLLLGVLGVAALRWLQMPPPRPARPVAVEHPQAMTVALDQPAPGAPAVLPLAPPVQAAPSAPGACGFDAMLPVSGDRDGRYDIAAAMAMPQRPRAAAFVAAAREAQAQQRWRDAEVALIVACRLVSPGPLRASVPLADAQARLAQLYAERARPQGAADEAAPAAAERGRELLVRSLADYTAVLGRQASKTLLAQRRLAALDAHQAMPADLAQAAADGGATTAMGAAPASPPGGPEVSQLASDLARLQAQAVAVSNDPAGLQRRAREAQAGRDACADDACLRRWYAQRREQLLREF
jgi:hypothetical protein